MRIKPEHRLDFKLTLQAQPRVVERTFIDAEMEDRLRAAAPLGSLLIVQWTLDDVDDLAGQLRRKQDFFDTNELVAGLGIEPRRPFPVSEF